MTFEVVYNTSLKIFSKLYVGVKPKKTDRAPLAFATPYETTSAGEKRQGTVQNWTRESTYGYKTKTYTHAEPDLRIVENIPRSGFKITDDVRRVYWGGGNVVWRLEDPLGWEIEIQSSNLMALIQAVGIEKDGLVPGECVLARDGNHNILLPVSSEEYKNAIKAAETVVKPGLIPMKERVIGRMYRLKDGTFGKYLGKLWITSTDYSPSTSNRISFLKLDLPGEGEVLVQANSTSCEILNGASEQYEAVFVPPETPPSWANPNGRVKLVKSMSLIAELNTESMSAAEACDLANARPKEFTGVKKISPLFASLEKDPIVQYVPVTASEEVFNRAVSRLVSHFERTTQDPRYTIAPMFQSYHHDVLVMGDDPSLLYGTRHSVSVGQMDEYRHFGEFNKPQMEHRHWAVLGRVIVDQNLLITLNLGGHRLLKDQPNQPNSLYTETFGIVPKVFSSLPELLEHIKELRAAGKFVELKPRAVK